MMQGLFRLLSNAWVCASTWVWYRFGWIRAGLLGVRLGPGARVSPKAHIKGAYFLGAANIASGVKIGRGSYVNSGAIDSGDIGAWCSIGYGVHIGPTEHDTAQWTTSPHLLGLAGVPSEKTEKRLPAPVIGHDVWLGSHVLVLRGVTIGNGAVIGAGAVVCSDVPPYSVAVGAPARVIKPRFASEVERLEAEKVLAQAMRDHG